MTKKLDEFSMNLPVVSAPEAPQEFAVNPGYEDSSASVMSAQDAPIETSITIGNPEPEVVKQDTSMITVYANSITSTSYNEKSDIVSFDVVFSVGITGEDGSSKTYQVVKRIGIDKRKIAAEAENTTPLSIVEGVKAADNNNGVAPAWFKTGAVVKFKPSANVKPSSSEKTFKMVSLSDGRGFGYVTANGKRFDMHCDDVMLAEQSEQKSVVSEAKRFRILAGLE